MNDHQAETIRRDLASLHDAELVSFTMDRAAKTIELVFIDIDNSKMSLGFGGVFSLKISQVLPQNVVSRILLSSAGNLPAGEVKEIVTWMFADDKQPVLLIEDENVERNINRVLTGDLSLLYVERSWGAEIAVMFETLNTRKLG